MEIRLQLDLLSGVDERAEKFVIATPGLLYDMSRHHCDKKPLT